jgi:hypothetical protein
MIERIKIEKSDEKYSKSANTTTVPADQAEGLPRGLGPDQPCPGRQPAAEVLYAAQVVLDEQQAEEPGRLGYWHGNALPRGLGLLVSSAW